MVEKKYKCTVCSRKFHTRDARDEHTLGQHRGEIIIPWRDNNPGYNDRYIAGKQVQTTMSTIQEYKKVASIKNKLEDDLFSYPNVVDVGVGHKDGSDELCIFVGVSEKVPEGDLYDDEKIPFRVETEDGESATTDVIEV